MIVPNFCPECKTELEYLSEPHLCDETNPQEIGFEGNCFKCGAIVYSKFKMFEVEVTIFDEDGNEVGKKKI